MKYEISRTTYNKFDNGFGWFELSKVTDKAQVYEDLAKRLFSKKVQNCKWITRITTEPLYQDELHKTTVYYNNGIKDVFIH